MAEIERGTTRGGPETGLGPGMIGQDSAGFIESFTAAVRPHEPRGRPLRWMVMMAFAIVFAATLGSLLNGAFAGGNGGSGSGGGSGGDTPLLGANPAANGLSGLQTLPAAGGAAAAGAGSAAGGSSTAHASFTAVAGPGCNGAGAAFTESGLSLDSTNPSTQWTMQSSGGYSGNGCGGAYVSMPVSGSATTLDAGRFTVWSFTLGAGLTAKASCDLEVYVPDSASTGQVGGAPAYYYYYDSVYTSQSSAKPLGEFAVNQTTNRGRWMATGRFAVTTGVVSVRMVDAGTDAGAGAAGVVRDAAAQVRISCETP